MGAVVILQLELAPRLAGLGHQVLHAHDHSRHGDLLPLDGVEILQLRELGLAHVVDDDFIVVQRVRREVESHHLALLRELLQLAPFGAGRKHRTLNVHMSLAAEQALLGVVLFGLEPLSVAHQLFDEGDAVGVAGIHAEELAAREIRDRVERPGVSEVLKTFAVDQRVVHPFDEVVDILERTVGLAFGDDALHGSLSDALHGGQSETDIAGQVGRELPHRLVDVGPQHADSHALALVHVKRQLLDVREVSAQHRSHVLRRVVGFEIGGLVGHPRIARGVRFVERIGGEFLPVGPYLFEHLRVVAVFLAALDELGFEVVQLVFELLTHSLAQRVRLAAGEVGQQTRQQHDLLLIDRDAVGVFQILLHHRNIVLDGAAAVLAGDEVRDVVHRAGPVEGVHRDQVLEGRGLQLAQVLLHARGLELERPDGAALAVEAVGRGVVDDREVVDVDLHALGQADVLHGVLDDRKGLQPQEVHLDKSRVLDHRAFILRDEHLFAGLLVVGRRDGHPVGDVVAANNRTAGVHARVADVAFEHLGIADRVPHHGVVRLLGGFQFGHIVDGVLQIELLVRNLVGNQLAEAVRLREQELLHARNVLDGQFGGHRTVGDDVRHLLLAVFLRHPVQHAAAAVVVEVHVDIGERNTVGVQETLEQQVVGDGVDLRDAETVGHGRTCGRATARSHRNVQFFACGADKVLHDEEVAWETHRLHNV